MDFLIEKKFFRRYRAWLRLTWTIMIAAVSILTYLGYTTLSDYRSFVDDLELAKSKLKPTYEEYLRKDSVARIVDENSAYSCDFVTCNNSTSPL